MPETVVHFQVRMAPGLHELLAQRAKEERQSLNALVVGLLNQAVSAHASGSKPHEQVAKAQSA